MPSRACWRSIPASTPTLPAGGGTALLRTPGSQGHDRLPALVHNPADEISLDRVINLPPRGIGDKTILALHTTARAVQSTPGAVLLDLRNGSDSPYWAKFSGRAALPLADIGAMLSGWIGAAQVLTVTELFDRIIKDTAYQEYIHDGTEEGEERWENVLELRRLTWNTQPAP